MITVFRRGFNIHFSRVFVSSGGYCKISDLYDNSFRRSAEIKEANNYIKVQHEINNENTKKKNKIYDIESDPSYYESKKYKMNTNTHTNLDIKTNYNINDTTYKTGKMIE